jgi:hypothetical protein
MRRRLISDRPLGVLLSGGRLNLTAAIAAQETTEVDAYTVALTTGFDEPPCPRCSRGVGLRLRVALKRRASTAFPGCCGTTDTIPDSCIRRRPRSGGFGKLCGLPDG